MHDAGCRMLGDARQVYWSNNSELIADSGVDALENQENGDDLLEKNKV